MVIYGEHRYMPGKVVQHILHFLDTEIKKANLEKNWGNAVATTLGSKVHLNPGRKKRVIYTIMSRPTTSPDYLVTWEIQ